MTENNVQSSRRKPWEEVPPGICQVGWVTEAACEKPGTVLIPPDLIACEEHAKLFRLGRKHDDYTLALEIVSDVEAYARTYGEDGEVLMRALSTARRELEAAQCHAQEEYTEAELRIIEDR